MTYFAASVLCFLFLFLFLFSFLERSTNERLIAKTSVSRQSRRSRHTSSCCKEGVHHHNQKPRSGKV